MPNYETPRGLRDFPPGKMDIRRNVISSIENVFRTYSFLSWDGPAFETIETLKQKAGTGVTNEIYIFSDKGGRELGLRFELTTSLARIIANSPNLKKPVKAYSIGKVWRYERPQEGRYREFLQADADIFGSESIGCECELLLLGKQVMGELGFYDFRIRLNNRKILYAQTELANIPKEKSADALRALDKLNKIGYDGVKDEFERSGLSKDIFSHFMKLMVAEGDNDYRLKTTQTFLQNNPLGQEGIHELAKIIGVLRNTELSDRIEIDPSLVRGLDYYTGPIFEIEISSGKEVGSVSGGGRYDNLIELFGGNPTPAVGISFGIERLIDLIEKDTEKQKRFDISSPTVQVIYQEEFFEKALEAAQYLRSRGIRTDLDLKSRSLKKQFSLASQSLVRYAIIIGEEEASTNRYTFRDMQTRNQSQYTLNEGMNRIIKNETI